MNFYFEDDYESDAFAHVSMSPSSPLGAPSNEEGAMFSDRNYTAGNYSSTHPAGNYSSTHTAGNYSSTKTAGNYYSTNTAGNYSSTNTAGNYSSTHPAGNDSSTTGKAPMQVLFEQFDEGLRYNKYANLCMAGEIRYNIGVHFQEFMKQKFKQYGVKRKDEVFFRNNAIFCEKSFYNLCDHLAVNHDVLQKVLGVFYYEAPQDLIRETIGRRFTDKTAIVNSSKSAVHSIAEETMHSLGSSSNFKKGAKPRKRLASHASVERHDCHDAQQSELSEYELSRVKNIADNLRLLHSVGIHDIRR
jgi:hypothetical protein